jgi:hypothetical protein
MHLLILSLLAAIVLCAVAGIVGLWSRDGHRDWPATDERHRFVTSPPPRFNTRDVYKIGHGVSPRLSRGGKS